MRIPHLLLCLLFLLTSWLTSPAVFGRDPMKTLNEFNMGAEGRTVPAASSTAQNATAAEENTGTVQVNSYLNVRSSPWGTIIGKLYNGARVTIIGRSGEWLKIRYNGRTAYVHSDYVGVNRSTNTGPGDSSNGGGTTTASGTTSPGGAGNSAALEAWRGGRLSPAEFVRLLGPIARESFRLTGVPASVTLAQAALETGWGRATIGNARNLFGIKGRGPAGSITVPTREYVNGRYVTVNAAFRKYNTWLESINDHANLLKNNSRYRRAFQYSNNPNQFATEVHRAGYATDPNYARTLISIMRSNNLYQWDR